MIIIRIVRNDTVQCLGTTVHKLANLVGLCGIDGCSMVAPVWAASRAMCKTELPVLVLLYYSTLVQYMLRRRKSLHPVSKSHLCFGTNFLIHFISALLGAQWLWIQYKTTVSRWCTQGITAYHSSGSLQYRLQK